MASNGPSLGSYTPFTGFIFIFNLIVGAGALTIPHAFVNVGIIYGSISLSLLASISYVTATYMIEAIAGVNALKRRAREIGTTVSNDGEKLLLDELSDSDDGDVHTEFMPLVVTNEKQDIPEQELRTRHKKLRFHFDLSKKIELAEMAELLFSHHGIIAFYACVTVYLYGDLAIYAVAVPKSLREIICPRPSADAIVWECSERLDSSDLYRLFVVLFGLLLSPFTFGHVHKTRTLQLVSTVIRHTSFGLMIVLASFGIARGHGRSLADVVSYEKSSNIATFFGVCIYSFMCHHSVPGLIAPVTDKRKVSTILSAAFMAVLSVYFVLSVSATFRFQPNDVEDVYTLNFKNYPVQAFGYFLSLFPVFTLSASFPLICITLRENIRHLASRMSGSTPASDITSPNGLCDFLKINMYALVALLPPLVVAFFTEDVSMLVGFTGAYAGLGIQVRNKLICISPCRVFSGTYLQCYNVLLCFDIVQWIVPTCLVFYLRHCLAMEWKQMHPMDMTVTHRDFVAICGNKNRYASPFGHKMWLYLVLGLSLLSLILITFVHWMH